MRRWSPNSKVGSELTHTMQPAPATHPATSSRVFTILEAATLSETLSWALSNMKYGEH